MPPRKLPAETLDTEDPGARVGQAATAIAEADEVAAAEARAEAARARAVRLRELADAASSDPVDWPDADDASDTEAERDDKVTLSEVEARRYRPVGDAAQAARPWLSPPQLSSSAPHCRLADTSCGITASSDSNVSAPRSSQRPPATPSPR